MKQFVFQIIALDKFAEWVVQTAQISIFSASDILDHFRASIQTTSTSNPCISTDTIFSLIDTFSNISYFSILQVYFLPTWNLKHVHIYSLSLLSSSLWCRNSNLLNVTVSCVVNQLKFVTPAITTFVEYDKKMTEALHMNDFDEPGLYFFYLASAQSQAKLDKYGLCVLHRLF